MMRLYLQAVKEILTIRRRSSRLTQCRSFTFLVVFNAANVRVFYQPADGHRIRFRGTRGCHCSREGLPPKLPKPPPSNCCCSVIVVVCLSVGRQLLTASWKLNYSWRCQLVDYSDDPDELRVCHTMSSFQ